MRRFASFRRGLAAFALLAGAGALAACEDGTTGPDGQVATGLVVTDAGGATVATFNGTSVAGTLRVGVGAQQTFRVQMTTAGGTRVSPADLGYTLRPTVVITAIAGVTAQGSDGLVVSGRTAGTTTVVLQVLEGGRAVFDPALTVVVGP